MSIPKQVYSKQQQSPGKCHPDWLTYGRMTAEKPIFGLQ